MIMLTKLLEEINRSHSLDVNILAKALGTTPSMVESMLSTLAQMGMIKPVDMCSASTCDDCPVNRLCSSTGKQARVWQVNKAET